MNSIAEKIAERSDTLSQREARGAFLKLCHMLLRHRTAYEAYQHVESERASPRVASILKAVVSGATTGNWGAVSDYVVVQEAYQQSLRDASVFDQVLVGGMVRAPLRSRGFSITTGVSGAVVPEGSIKVISSLTMASQLLELRKSSAIIVVSEELADYPGSQTLFANELQRAVIFATDQTFLAGLIAATTPVASAGSSLVQITTDLSVLLSAITTSATSRVFFVTSALNLKKLILKANTIGAPAFPSLSLTGGTMLGGITAIASDAIPSGAALMFSSDAIVGNSDQLLPGKSEQSTLQLESTSPDSPPLTTTALVSLWQSNLRALRVERYFGFTVMRATGIASLSGVAY